ncbi:VOC family protein [Ottowia testudinis]|uniref:VOC family protein n=2 Tax=Ottowia testudinis TaxID=2816950 RepID=A0A975CLR2_9BURK|nr:VOC family protein [Ottowia testudinis]
MFQGQAQAAIDLYAATLPDTRVLQMQRREAPTSTGGTVLLARVAICGQAFLFSDSAPVHAFTFTPSSSIFVECDSEDEQTRVFNTLADGGGVLMPLADYGFSRRFGWLNDRFGVSWQLNLAA